MCDTECDTCQIQWIDGEGELTPDDNRAVGRARRWVAVSDDMRERLGVRGEPYWSRWYPICADHLATMRESGIDTPTPDKPGYWEFEPFAAPEDGIV